MFMTDFISIKSLLLLLCVCMHDICVSTSVCMWKSEDTVGSLIFFPQWEKRVEVRLSSLPNKQVYPLVILMTPVVYLLSVAQHKW